MGRFAPADSPPDPETGPDLPKKQAGSSHANGTDLGTGPCSPPWCAHCSRQKWIAWWIVSIPLDRFDSAPGPLFVPEPPEKRGGSGNRNLLQGAECPLWWAKVDRFDPNDPPNDPRFSPGSSAVTVGYGAGSFGWIVSTHAARRGELRACVRGEGSGGVRASKRSKRSTWARKPRLLRGAKTVDYRRAGCAGRSSRQAGGVGRP